MRVSCAPAAMRSCWPACWACCAIHTGALCMLWSWLQGERLVDNAARTTVPQKADCNAEVLNIGPYVSQHLGRGSNLLAVCPACRCAAVGCPPEPIWAVPIAVEVGSGQRQLSCPAVWVVSCPAV